MRPIALAINAGDFALAAPHRRIAISLLAGTLRWRRPRQISCGGLVRRLDDAKPNGFAGELVDIPSRRLRRFGLRWFGLLGHARSTAGKQISFNLPQGEASSSRTLAISIASSICGRSPATNPTAVSPGLQPGGDDHIVEL
jgi:hypothetical protein